MEDDNKIGDFFRKKFGDFSEDASAWERPDAGMRASILEKVNQPVKVEFPYWKAILGTVLVLTSSFAAYSYWTCEEEISDLKIALKEEVSKREVADSELVELETELMKCKEEISNNKDKPSNENTNLEDTREGKNASVISVEKGVNEKSNFDLLQNSDVRTDFQVIEHGNNLDIDLEINRNEVERFESDAIPNTTPYAIAKIETAPIRISPSIPSLDFQDLNTQVNLNFNQTSEAYLLERKKNLSIGYEFVWQSLQYHNTYEFEKQRLLTNPFTQGSAVDIDREYRNWQKITIPQSGFLAAYSLNEKIQFKTGFRFGKKSINDNANLSFRYNNENEIEGVNGEITNELILINRRPYKGAEEHIIDLSFSEQERLEEEDIYVIQLTQSEDLTFFQIPLSIAYRKEFWKIGAEADLGGTWNSLTMKNYSLKSAAIDDTRDLSANIREENFPKVNRQYFGVFGSLALTYQLSDKWQIRSAYAINRYFNKQESNTIYSKYGTLYSLGLNYHL